MRWRRLLVLSLLGACGDAHALVGEDSGAIDAPGVEESRAYVVSRMNAEPMLPSTQAYGLDLDGRTNGTPGECNDAFDFTSPISGAMGVDNQFVNFYPTLDGILGEHGTDGQIETAILGGKLVILIVVEVVSSWVNDASVTARVVVGTLAPGETLALDPSGHGLAPGNTFHVGRDLGAVPAAITDGVLTLETPGAIPVFFFRPEVPALPVSHVHVRAPITTGGLGTGMQGEIAGEIAIDDIVTWFMQGGATVDHSAIESLVMPDLEPDATGAACAAASMGVAFEAVEATLVP